MKKLLIFFSIFVLISLSLGMTAYAASDDVRSGSWGALSWTLNETTGELVISGTGSMNSLGDYNAAWKVYRASVKSIRIEEGVTSVSYGAFEEFGELKSVALPSTLTLIDGYGFEKCGKLERVVIPDGVTRIGYRAFEYCTSLSDITIPDSVYEIGVNAFIDTAYLNNSSNWENDALYINKHLIDVKAGVQSYTVKEGTRSIGGEAFYDCSQTLGAITIPDSVIGIGPDAFLQSGYYYVDAINVNERSVYIKDLTAWCKIQFSNQYSNPLSFVGRTIFGDLLYSNLYLNGTLVTDLTIPNGISAIGAYVFYDYTRLTSVTIPDSVTSIGSYAFYDCTGLTSVTIGAGVTAIEDGAFHNCTGLTEINFNATAMEDCKSHYNIFYNAGRSGSGITVNIGANVTRIPAYLFYSYYGNSPKLTSVIFAAGSKCTSIGASAFYNCTALLNLAIPDSVTSIGALAFRGTSFLDNKNNYENGVLYVNHILLKVDDTLKGGCTVRQGTNDIAADAFYDCDGLTSITIPNSVTNIGDYAFYSCDNLTNIMIPKSVTSIGRHAFSYCTSLETLTYCGNKQEWMSVIGTDNYASYVNCKISYHDYDWTTESSTKKTGVCSICQHAVEVIEEGSVGNVIKNTANIIPTNVPLERDVQIADPSASVAPFEGEDVEQSFRIATVLGGATVLLVGFGIIAICVIKKRKHAK